MRVIQGRNVNQIWDQAKVLLNHNGILRPSRVGEVLEVPWPVTSVYEQPCERVLFDSFRNANVIFSLMESLWMLAGRNDVAWIERFNSKIRDFVGDAEVQHGAYGYRWRKAFDMDGGAEDDFADQLPKIIRMLRSNHNERRAVLTMWNPLWDLERPDVPDVPCNTQVYFKIRNEKLDIVVTCRSNDILFGAYSANNVQFSMLQEYMAAMIEVPVGIYYQVSDSWHAYTERWNNFGGYDEVSRPDYYQSNAVSVYPLICHADSFDVELQKWMNRDFNSVDDFENAFFSEVAEPLWKAWDAYKENDLEKARTCASLCEADDWRFASVAWFDRIIAKRNSKG